MSGIDLAATAFSELSAVESVWREMETGCDHFAFQSFDWAAHWQRTIGAHSGAIPQIVLVEGRGRPVALFPFVLKRAAGIRILEFLGGAQSDYNAALVAPDAATHFELGTVIEAALAAVARHDMRVFARIPDSGGSGSGLPAQLGARAAHSACAARLVAPWEEFSSRVPKKLAADTRRQQKKVAELGTIEFVVASDVEMLYFFHSVIS